MHFPQRVLFCLHHSRVPQFPLSSDCTTVTLLPVYHSCCPTILDFPSPLGHRQPTCCRITRTRFHPYNVARGPTVTNPREPRSWQPAAPLQECIPFPLRGTLEQRHAALSPAGKTTAQALHFLTAPSLLPAIEPSQQPAPGSVQEVPPSDLSAATAQEGP